MLTLVIPSTEAYNMPPLSSSVIEYIQKMRMSSQAPLAFFYCDFRNDQKKDWRGLLSSLLVQLRDRSNAYCAILSNFYLAYDNGFKYAGDCELVQCLKTMLELPNQATTYIVIDALDECSASTLQASNLRICVTSRPEVDIESVLSPLAFRSVLLHDESGQAQDIAEYIKFVVYNDPKMRAWRKADKELTIDVLKRADGM